MFKKSLISSAGMGMATALGQALMNIDAERRRKAQIDQENYRLEAIEREKRFLREHKRFMDRKEMLERYEPLKREFAATLRIQNRFIEVSKIFADAGIDPALVLSPQGPSVEDIKTMLLETALKEKKSEPVPFFVGSDSTEKEPESIDEKLERARNTTLTASTPGLQTKRAVLLMQASPFLSPRCTKRISDCFKLTRRTPSGSFSLGTDALLEMLGSIPDIVDRAENTVRA